jgi:hypothetical protein
MDWVDKNKKRWPDFIYHTTSLGNLLNILTTGRLCSREVANKDGLFVDDIADEKVIERTEDKWKSYVRFYLRPNTPTLFNNEGIRPNDKIINKAHCPIPISLLFDSREILSRKDSKFSNGNLGSSSAKIYQRADSFKKLSFEKIYHTGGVGFTPDITFHRNAEVLVPYEVDLRSLKYIICRSEAEKQTLQSLLGHIGWLQWSHIVKLELFPIFNKTWLYVEKVEFNQAAVVIHFNETILSRKGPFNFEWGCKIISTKEELSGNRLDYNFKKTFRINREKSVNESILFWVKLNGILVYRNKLRVGKENLI